MSNAITPTPSEQEMMAVKALHAASDGESLLSETHAATIIAAHTRYACKTAEEWYELRVDALKALAQSDGYRLASEAALNEERARHHVQHQSALNDLAKAQARVKELEQMPCDSPQANEWLNANAPTNVLQSLWAWRRIAEDGLALRDKRIAGLVAAAVECGEVTPGNVQADTREQSR